MEAATARNGNNIIDGEFVCREDMARMLKISVRTLVRLTHKPNGLPHLAFGGRTLYRVDSVRSWLASQEKTPGETRRKRRVA